jgi:transcriptional regulator with XRE-family HTH domain
MSPIYLKEWRNALGVTVRALESRSGVSLASIVRIESGRQDPTVSLIERLAEGLEIETTQLFRPPERDSTGRRRQRPRKE